MRAEASELQRTGRGRGGSTPVSRWVHCESVSASERQDKEQVPRETGTRQGRTPPTGDPHRGEDPAEDTPPEGRATQGTHTEHTDRFDSRGE